MERSNRATIERLGEVEVATLAATTPAVDDLARAGATLPFDRWIGAAREQAGARLPHRQWLHVLGVTYAVDEALLVPHLPRGAQIDTLEGSPRVSIVAFHFRRTRLRGVPIPLHVNFGEINLRFYVRLHDRRAVVFIREFVSRPAISIIAKLTYNEPYRTIRMRDEVLGPRADGLVGVRHRFGRGLGNRLEAWADPEPVVPAEDSAAYWLTHHDLGVGRGRDGRRALLRGRASGVGAARGALAGGGGRLRCAVRAGVGVSGRRRAVARDAGGGVWGGDHAGGGCLRWCLMRFASPVGERAASLNCIAEGVTGGGGGVCAGWRSCGCVE